MPFLSGEAEASPRKEFIYWNDDGQLVAIRYEELEGRLLRAEPRGHRRLGGPVRRTARAEALQPALRPAREGRHLDPLRQVDGDRAFVQVPMQAFAARWLSSFKDFPPRQKPASFNLDEVLEKLTEAAGSTR